MNTIPKISIIVPVYQVEKYICRCINSILNQSLIDFELLLINDGSTDKSREICDSYALIDKRIRVFHKDNGGVSVARNFGIERAEGLWLYFVDADDELYPNTLETLIRNTNDTIDYVMAGYTTYSDNEKMLYSVDILREKIIDNQESITQMFVPEDYKYHGYLWNKLFRRDIIIKNKLRFDEDIFFNEDRLFNVRYLLKIENNKCFYTTEPVYKYYERKGSAMDSLKISYNQKYTTDLTAFLRMLADIKISKNAHNIKLCKKASYSSYKLNIIMMKKFRVYDKVVEGRMYKELREQISINDIISIKLNNIVIRMIRKLQSYS